MKSRPQFSPYLAALAVGSAMFFSMAPAQANLCDLPARSLTPEQLEAIAQQGCPEDAIDGQAARPGAPTASGVPGAPDDAAATTDEAGGINVGVGGGAAGNTGGINVGVGTNAASGNTGGISVGVGEGAATGNTGGVNADVGGGGTGAGSGNEGGIGVGVGGEGGIGATAGGEGIGVTVGQ